MTVYHGSNVEVHEPKILKPNRELDFGNGFYTTTNIDQAIAFARLFSLYDEETRTGSFTYPEEAF